MSHFPSKPNAAESARCCPSPAGTAWLCRQPPGSQPVETRLWALAEQDPTPREGPRSPLSPARSGRAASEPLRAGRPDASAASGSPAQPWCSSRCRKPPSRSAPGCPQHLPVTRLRPRALRVPMRAPALPPAQCEQAGFGAGLPPHRDQHQDQRGQGLHGELKVQWRDKGLMRGCSAFSDPSAHYLIRAGHLKGHTA